MSKHIVSLVLVLALAGMASAIQWVGPAYTDSPRGNWNTATNWDSTSVPASSDAIVRFDRLDGLGGQVIVDAVSSGGVKVQTKFGKADLLITSTGRLNNDGSVEQGKGTTSLVTIEASAIWDACQKKTQTTGQYKLSSASDAIDAINIYGTLNVKNTGTKTTVASDIYVAQGAGGGTGRVYIRDGGLLDVDAYTINSGSTNQPGSTTKRGTIQIYTGGLMKIKGDKLTQVNADITAGTIVNYLGTTEDEIAWTQRDATGAIYTYVPEPATIALLGLGSLTLLRRKR